MSIYAIDLKNLPNEAHFSFHKEVETKLDTHSATALGVEALVASYVAQITREDTALEIIRKSGLTAPLEVADQKRDNLFRGFSLTVDGACLHYDPSKQQAALGIQLVLDHYGNVAQKMRDAESGSIINLVNELRSNHAQSLTALSLGPWLDALEAANEDYRDLRGSRDSETGSRTALRMVEERPKTDDIYRSIVERINALIIVNGSAAYEAFVNDLNGQIEHYKQIIAQRKGHAASGTASEGETENSGTGEINPVTLP
jgi:hypothetical protein